MSIEMNFHSSPAIGTRLTEISIRKTLQSLCLQAIQVFRDLVYTTLRLRLPSAVFSERAKTQIPALTAPVSLLDSYLQCFQIDVRADACALVIDRAALRARKLPEHFPEMLEYGSELGIPAIPHLQVSWRTLLREHIPALRKDAMHALI